VVLPFSTILSIFDQKSYPPVGGFSATASTRKPGFDASLTGPDGSGEVQLFVGGSVGKNPCHRVDAEGYK